MKIKAQFHWKIFLLEITFFNVDGTGPHGRILKGDVINFMKENNIAMMKPKLMELPTTVATQSGIYIYIYIL